MAVTIHVNGRSNSLAHKGCMGITKSTIPDVCKTPSPGGPIPIPYPVIVSMSNSLKKGTKTVKVDGKNSAAIKGSEYSRCNGDEPGTAGGVKSSTNMKEATWILYSFDVKLDGKNACRLSDKMMMNHGNTACLNGTVHLPVIPGQKYDDQTCYDTRREEIHAEQKKVEASIPSFNGLFDRGPKRFARQLAKTDCSDLQDRCDKQKKELEVRKKMMKECFRAAPRYGPYERKSKDNDVVSAAHYRAEGHKQKIKDTLKAVGNTQAAMKTKGC